MTILYNNVALIGLGLIASSIGHGLKKWPLQINKWLRKN